MRHVYGPVPSRRLGKSLGIDPIPFKTCNWNCVYCQLGRTSPLTNERRDYFPPAEIVAEVEAALKAHRPGEIDWITFVGSGEPTLHASLGAMIRRVKEITDLPVAVITNGSLLHRPDVREELLLADAVLPSVDAGTERLYQKINRPCPELGFQEFIDGVVAFREQYRRKLWIEVMLIQGLNDSDEALQDLANVLQRMRPDEVHLNSPVRPPSEPWVKPPGEAGFRRALHWLGNVAHVVPPSSAGEIDLSNADNVVEAVAAVLLRHPMREDELIRMLAHWMPGQVTESLQQLAHSGQAQLVERDGQRFWSSASARYVSEELMRCHEAKPKTQGA